MQLFGDPFDDALSWTTGFSRTRFTSTDNLSLLSNASFATVSDLQGMLGVVQSLKLRQIPYNTLKEISFVSEGNTFAVYKHQWNDKVVAVKHIKRQLLDDDGDVNVSRRRLQSVLQEILIMNHSPVIKHPNIVDLIGYGWRLDNRMPLPYVVVSYGSLGSLRPYLISKAPSSLKHKAMLAGDIAAGLLILHQSGIVHGDLKLDNVVVYPTRERDFGVIAKICDFGHSIALSTAEKPLRYHGTPLYMPPEALDQTDNPILAQDLHKCDIWAFGLCLWEVIIDGNLYFHRDWRYNVNFSRSTLLTASSDMDSAQPYFNTPKKTMTPATTAVSTNAFDSDVFDGEVNDIGLCFGNFDLSYLQALAQKALFDLYPRQTWERTYLAPLLRSTLNINPSKRISDLNRSPLMNVWHNTYPQDALQTQLAMHSSSSNSSESYDLFRPDRQADIPWEYQEHIKRDLESVARSSIEKEKVASASFQLMACNALGFGCNVNLGRARQYLDTAVDLGLHVAHLFSDALTDAMMPISSAKLEPYTTKVARAFFQQRCLNMASELYLCSTCEAEDDVVELKLGIAPATGFTDVLKQAISISRKSRNVVISTTWLVNGAERIRLSWLEFAILMDDLVLLQSCCDAAPRLLLDKVGVWDETPLILACRRGKSDMVQALLTAGHDWTQSVRGGASLLHWLFCLGDDAVAVLDRVVEISGSKTLFTSKINESCTAVHSISLQWPTEFTGTPLAFAVISGHRSLVQKLLQLGADPTITVYCPPTTSGPNPSWTPIHLSIKYNFPEILGDMLDHVLSQQLEQRSPELMFKKLSDKLHQMALKFDDFQLAAALSYLTPLERFAIHGRLSAARLNATIAALPKSVLYWSSRHGITPLWQAIDFENVEVVIALLNNEPGLAGTEIQDSADSKSRMLPLHYAAQICARRGSSDALIIPEAIFAAHKSAYTTGDGAGRLPLHLSVSTNFAFVTEWLVKIGTPVDASDLLGRTPLMLCRSASNTRMLLQNHADVRRTDSEGLNSAHHAVARGTDESLPLLIENGIDLDKISSNHGTALHVAVAGSSVSCVEQLCKAGVLVDVTDRHGNTPLAVAVAARRSDNVEVLMRYGASVAIPNAAGLKPTAIVLEQIGSHKPSECPVELRSFQALVNVKPNGDDTHTVHTFLLDVLHDVAKMDNPALMKFFLSLPSVLKKIDINSAKDGRTPLHSAVQSLSIETARFLLEKGADPNQVDHKGATPLLILCSEIYPEVNKLNLIDLLLSQWPRLTAFDHQGKSAWSIAQERGDYMIMTRLLERVPEDDIDTMLHEDPITWHLLDLALSQKQTKFFLACLRHATHIPFLNAPTVLSDISRAMNCEPKLDHVLVILNDVLKYHQGSVIARDALSGRSIARWLQKHFSICGPADTAVYSRLWDRADSDSMGIPDGEVSDAIADYLITWESWNKSSQRKDTTRSEVADVFGEAEQDGGERGMMIISNKNDCNEQQEQEKVPADRETCSDEENDGDHDMFDDHSMADVVDWKKGDTTRLL